MPPLPSTVDAPVFPPKQSTSVKDVIWAVTTVGSVISMLITSAVQPFASVTVAV